MNAYILAGGKSSRMGTNKALMEFCGIPMSIHISNMLLQAGIEKVFLITKTPLLLPIPQLVELYEESHPLYGVHIALAHSKEQLCLITPCDMPLVSISSYKKLRNQKTPTVALGATGKHPLLGVYPQNIREKALIYAQEERSVMSFVETFSTILIPNEELRNINYPHDREEP